MLIRDFIPYFRRQGDGRIIQLSSYGGQVAYAANSLYHATKFGIEGFCESVAQEVAQFNIGVTIVEPDGARTQFRYANARVTPNLMPAYEKQHDFLKMLDPKNGLAPGDLAKADICHHNTEYKFGNKFDLLPKLYKIISKKKMQSMTFSLRIHAGSKFSLRYPA